MHNSNVHDREEGGRWEPVYELVFAPKQKIIFTASCAHTGNYLRLIAPIKRGCSRFQRLHPLYEERQARVEGSLRNWERQSSVRKVMVRTNFISFSYFHWILAVLICYVKISKTSITRYHISCDKTRKCMHFMICQTVNRFGQFGNWGIGQCQDGDVGGLTLSRWFEAGCQYTCMYILHTISYNYWGS